MAKAVTLKVRARADRMVVDFEAMKSGARRFVGRQYTAEHPARTPKAMAAALSPVRIDEPTAYDHRSHWPRRQDTVEKPARAEYMIAVKRGDLLAADDATAKLCGVSLAEHDKIHAAESHEEWEEPAAEEHAQ